MSSSKAAVAALMKLPKAERLQQLGLQTAPEVQTALDGGTIDSEEASRIVVETCGQDGWEGLLGEDWAKSVHAKYQHVRVGMEPRTLSRYHPYGTPYDL